MIFIFYLTKALKKHIQNWINPEFTFSIFFKIPDGELLEGFLPVNKEKLVKAWIEIHKEDLMANWQLAVTGNTVFKIDPLK